MMFTGTPTTGRGRAKTLGFSTVNLHNINSMVIENGVYAAWATINGNRLKAALFIGESPTFKDKEKSVELHLIGMSDEEIKKYNLDQMKDTKIAVETVEYLRPVIKFESKEKLISQIGEDVEKISKILEPFI